MGYRGLRASLCWFFGSVTGMGRLQRWHLRAPRPLRSVRALVEEVLLVLRDGRELREVCPEADQASPIAPAAL
eukprot:14678604-Alexandrium_andersonii.AAC.1